MTCVCCGKESEEFLFIETVRLGQAEVDVAVAVTPKGFGEVCQHCQMQTLQMAISSYRERMGFE